MFGDRELELLLRGELELDCPVMRLSGRWPLVGSGFIRQRPESGFEFRIYNSEVPKTSRFFDQYIERQPAGTLIRSDDLERLEATDNHGQLWIAERVRSDRETSAFEIARGAVQEIVADYSVSTVSGSYLAVHFRGDLHYPTNAHTTSETKLLDRSLSKSMSRDAAVVPISGGELVARKRLNEVTFEWSSALAEIPSGAEWRLIEGLEFLENAPLSWCAVERTQGSVATVRLRGDLHKVLRSRQLPPLPNDAIDEPESYWRCVTAMLQRSTTSTDLRTRDALATRIHAVALACQAPLEAKALAATVAVEGLLDDGLPNTAAVTRVSESDVAAAVALLTASELCSELKQRLIGLARGIHSPSASDKLAALVSTDRVSEQEFQAWKYLRNRLVHGVLPESGQELVDQTMRVLTLFHKLVLMALGFEGLYRDYGTRDWPLKVLPTNGAPSTRDTSSQSE